MQIVETNKNIKEIPSFYNSAASKACRSAVMIGDELIKNKMIEIVHRMSDLKSPWNCPHGRPSLISLGGFSSIIGKIKSPKTNYKFWMSLLLYYLIIQFWKLIVKICLIYYIIFVFSLAKKLFNFKKYNHFLKWMRFDIL